MLLFILAVAKRAGNVRAENAVRFLGLRYSDRMKTIKPTTHDLRG
jgi:hypothetical protein